VKKSTIYGPVIVLRKRKLTKEKEEKNRKKKIENSLFVRVGDGGDRQRVSQQNEAKK
jgi:hypothetical protein